MARRAGKAASRKARQRNVPRAPRPAPSPAAPIEPTSSAAAAGAAEPTARRAPVPTSYAGGSTLTATERSEYHYVERDLRNIGILTAVMFGLLLAAWALFTATGLIG
jgi:hypothetical protein